MLDDKKRSEIEQSFASGFELIPRMWRGMYEGCCKSGFTPEQAFLLVQTYILKDCQYGINGTTGTNTPGQPPEDDVG